MAKTNNQLKNQVKKKIDKFIQILKEDRLPIRAVYLYGSQINGTARPGSDIDVCVISSRFKDRSQALDYLWQKRRGIDYLLEPIGYHPKDFVNEDPLVWEIKQHGVRVV